MVQFRSTQHSREGAGGAPALDTEGGLLMLKNPQLQFDHLGVPTTEPQPGESYIPDLGIWVTDPQAHPSRVEFIRAEAGSPLPELMKRLPHVAFQIPAGTTLAEMLAGEEVVFLPYEVQAGRLSVAFIRKYGILFEFMQFTDGPAG